jgi:hypothetical protein
MNDDVLWPDAGVPRFTDAGQIPSPDGGDPCAFPGVAGRSLQQTQQCAEQVIAHISPPPTAVSPAPVHRTAVRAPTPKKKASAAPTVAAKPVQRAPRLPIDGRRWTPEADLEHLGPALPPPAPDASGTAKTELEQLLDQAAAKTALRRF